MSKDLAMQENENQLNSVQWDLHEVEESKPLEFTEENKAELFGLEPVKATEMVSGLSTTLAERQVLKDAYVDVISLEITTENLSTFKELRLKIMKNRTQGLDKWKEKEKAFYLAGGRFVDSIYNKEVSVNQEMESKLLEAEKFFENQEKEKKRLLNLERIEKIKIYVEDTTGLDFSDFSDENFDDFVLGKKTRYNEKIEAEKQEAIRIENERLAEIERQRLVKIENEKIRIENAHLQKEAELKEAELQKERKLQAEKEAKLKAENDEKLQAEKEAREKIEHELKSKKDAETKAENERLEKIELDKKAAALAAKAPVKEKLSIWVESFELPITSVENETSKEIKEKFEAFKKWSINQINNL